MYYDDASPDEVHQAMVARDARRGETRDALSRGDGNVIDRIVSEAVKHPAVQDYAGTEMLVGHRGQSPSPLLQFNHGLCPGGQCELGGPKVGSEHRSVWRPFACSQCRLRVTGPDYLRGLIQRADTLMVEFKMPQARELELNQQIERMGKAGNIASLRRASLQEQRLRSQIHQEWLAERTLIELCQQLISSGSAEGLLFRRADGSDMRKFEVVAVEVHELELELAHKVIMESKGDPEFTFDLPAGTEEFRNKSLRAILQANSLASLFYSLPEHLLQRSLDLSAIHF